MISTRTGAVALATVLVACATNQGRRLQTTEATLASDILAASAETSGLTWAASRLEQRWCSQRASKRALCRFRRLDAKRKVLQAQEPPPPAPVPETHFAPAVLPEREPEVAPVVAEPEPEPLRPARRPVRPRAQPVALRGVRFGFDSARLAPAARSALEEALDRLTEHDDGWIRIEGHADSIGAESYNRRLSERRARAIAFYLAAHGVPRSRLLPVGLGEAHPIADNSTAAGRARNRRAELTVLE